MPEALDYMLDPYSRDAQNMWGPYYSRGWFNNDPKLTLGNLRNSTVFVSPGTGNPYPGEGLRRPGTDQINQVVEGMSRLSSRTFTAQAAIAGVKMHTNMRPQGSRNWMSWKKDMEAAWPVIVEALNVDQ